jgi:phage terminase Nu1 subunit (DNA packaging protein)
MTRELYSAYAASRALEKDRQTIIRALRDVPPDSEEKKGQPRWKLATIVKALESGPRGTGSNAKSQEAGLTEARAELAREQTEAIALKNAATRGDLIPVAIVKRSAGIIIAAFRERCLAIPGKIAASCEMRSRGEIEEIVRGEIYEALDELSRPILVDPPAQVGNDDAVAAADDEVEK